MSTRTPIAIVAIVVAGGLAGCGSDGGDSSLSTAGQEGKRVANSNGCAACHGSDGDGGVGPSWVGLYGSTVELEDGTTVVADEAYLTESIRDPGAKRVADFSLPMPVNSLSDAEVASVVAFIKDLAAPDTADAQP